MATARSYQDPCGIARALDHIGERWSLLVIRELLLGPKRFTDLRAGLPQASGNVLSHRLDELVADGIVHQRQLPPPAHSWVYESYPAGKELEPVLLALARWGSRVQPVPRGELSPDALLFALRTTLAPGHTRRTPLVVELRLGTDHYRIAITDEVEVQRGPAGDAAAVLATDPATLRRLVFGDLALADATRRGLITIDGDHRAAVRFLGSFRRPARS